MAFPSIEQLTNTLEPLARANNIDIESIKIARAGKKSTVSIAVDSDNRIDSDSLERISKEISELFDEQEEQGALNFGAGYILQVSTPGVEAPLRKARHWRRNQGRLVNLIDGDTKSLWRIGAVDDTDTYVTLIKRNAKNLEIEQVELGNYPDSVVEIEFSEPASDEKELAALPFDKATVWREENNK